MKKKLVTINTAGLIKELAGGICGPVLTPTYISIDSIYRMISGGKKVIEVNPKNRKQTLVLDKFNYKADNFNTVDRSDIVPKLMEEAQRKEEAKLEAIKKQEEAERIAKEEAEKASAIVQEDDPSVIPVHVDEEVAVVDNEETPSDEPAKEPSVVEGFDVSRNNNKKNKKHGDFRK